ncbi:MAG: hypothetical protein OXK76_16725 [Gammaproteobacteria bacterium]|nr:hypothetical protein [Gammaproteobacteria bacterium]
MRNKAADEGTRHDSHLGGPLAILLLACAPVSTPADEPAWHALVERTLAETCAIRKLPIKHPVEVRPMATFEGGYTKGIGSTVWEEQYAGAWRDGWCAVGVYCESRDKDKGTVKSAGRPRGLYDPAANVLYVNTESEEFNSTVAHEFTHALQHQNFPALNALHLWYNRDLAAAGNTVIEGGAHVVGWSFRPSRRMQLCMMTVEEDGSRQPQWWDWAPDDFTALEMFPHAFGPAISMEALLAGGTDGLDALLANPPLSTLAVLRPAQAGAVDFIRLPVDTLAGALSGRNCAVGLRNTVGAVGIWALFRIHDGASGNRPPAFVDEWQGDRFVHLSCPDENDELAWLTRWRTTRAAEAFAQRFRAIAPSVAKYGGVLGANPTAVLRNRSVIVATPGLVDTVAAIETSEVRTFARYDDWIESGCFPQEACYDTDGEGDQGEVRSTFEDGACPLDAQTPRAFSDWLARVRRARDPSLRRIGETEPLAAAAGRLGVFCATNTAGNSDLKNACRAGYGSVGYLARLDADPDWQLLPACLGSEGFRAWLESAYYADVDRPFASPRVVATTHGAALAVRVLERAGAAGLREWLDAPPMSMLQLLRPDQPGDVEFIRMPRSGLAEAGCHIGASESQGVLGIWNLLMDYGRWPEEDGLPSFLEDWRGDHQSFIRCDDGGEGETTGWTWTSRWRTTESAEAFASHFRALAPAAADETGFSAAARVHLDQGTVWILAPELEPLAALLKDGVESRAYADFRDWVADGCFPRDECN